MGFAVSCLIAAVLIAYTSCQTLSDSPSDESKTRILLYQMSQDIAEIKSMLHSVVRGSRAEEVEETRELTNHKLMDQMRKLLLLKNMGKESVSGRLAVKRDPPVGFYAVRGKRAAKA